MSVVNELFDRYMAELTAGGPEHAMVPIARAIFDARLLASQPHSMPPTATSPAAHSSAEAPQQRSQFGAMGPPSERSNPYEDMTAPSSPLPGFGYTRTPPEARDEAEVAVIASLSAAAMAVPASPASRLTRTALAALDLGSQSSRQTFQQLEARFGVSVPATPVLPSATQAVTTSSASLAENTASAISSPFGHQAQSYSYKQPNTLPDGLSEASTSATTLLPAPALATASSEALPATNMATTTPAPLGMAAQSPEQSVFQPETPAVAATPEQSPLSVAMRKRSESLPLQNDNSSIAMLAPLEQQAQCSEEVITQPETQRLDDNGSESVARGLQFGAMPYSASLLRDGITPALLWQTERQFEDDELTGEQAEEEASVCKFTRGQKHTLQFGSMISPFAKEAPPAASTSPEPQEFPNKVNSLSHEEAVSKVLQLLAEKHSDNHADRKREIIQRARQFYKNRDTSDLPPRKQVKRKITGPAYAICELLRYMPREDLMQVLEEAFVAVGTLAESSAEDSTLATHQDPNTAPTTTLPPQQSSPLAAKTFSETELEMYKISRPMHLKEMGLATYSRIPEDLYHADTVKLAREFLDDTLADSDDAMEALEEAFDRLNRQRGFVHSAKHEFPPIRKAAREFVKVFKGVPIGARNCVLDAVHRCYGGGGLELRFWHAKEGETEEERLAREVEGRRLMEANFDPVFARMQNGWGMVAGGTCLLKELV